MISVDGTSMPYTYLSPHFLLAEHRWMNARLYTDFREDSWQCGLYTGAAPLGSINTNHCLNPRSDLDTLG